MGRNSNFILIITEYFKRFVKHLGCSTVDIYSIYKSKQNMPKHIELRQCVKTHCLTVVYTFLMCVITLLIIIPGICVGICCREH